MRVEFFFDPACFRSWLTSRWLVEVAPQRDLRVRWRSYSNLLAQGTAGLDDDAALERIAAHRALRVLESARREDPERTGRLYEVLVEQARAEQAANRPPFSHFRRALREAGLSPRHAAAARQDCWDDEILASMAEAHSITGEGACTPIVILWLGSLPVVFHGLLLSPVPRGRSALALWDALVQLANVPGALKVCRVPTSLRSLTCR